MATKEDEKHYPTRTESSLLFIHHISEQGVFDSAAGARHSPQGLIHLDISLQEVPIKERSNCKWSRARIYNQLEKIDEYGKI